MAIFEFNTVITHMPLHTRPRTHTRQQQKYRKQLKLVGATEEVHVFDMLQPILAQKYPAITPEEEDLSIPLQVSEWGHKYRKKQRPRLSPPPPFKLNQPF